jgi:plastocyanin
VKAGNLLLKAGQKVVLKVANNDHMQHNLQFKATKVDRNLPVGKATTTLTAPQAGTYVFQSCISCCWYLQ